MAKNKQINKKNVHILARFRGWIQAAAALLTNMHLPNFLNGSLNRGKGKYACVPGLNCYSCPGAAGSCPIGAFQAVVGSSKFKFSYYVTGILILLGVLLGRFICGFLCPFGWFQELLHKIPSPKLSTQKLKPLRYLKYGILLVMVILLPMVVVNELGMGDPFFCKYLCPQGVLEGAIPLSITNEGIRTALGTLFSWKAFVLLAVILGSVFFLPPVLQMAVSAGSILCTFESGIAFSDEGGQRQMRILRSLCKGMQNGCRCYQTAQPCRVYPLRHVYEILSDPCHMLSIWFWRSIKGKKNFNRKKGA